MSIVRVRHVRAVLAVSALALLPFVLAGCTMDEGTQGIIGLTISGGHVQALVRNCGGYKTSTVELNNGAHGAPFVDADPVWKNKEMGSGRVDLGSVAKFVMLIPAHDYAPLFASPRGGVVDVTRKTIRALKEGEILTTSPHATALRGALSTVTLNSLSYEKQASAACDGY